MNLDMHSTTNEDFDAETPEFNIKQTNNSLVITVFIVMDNEADLQCEIAEDEFVMTYRHVRLHLIFRGGYLLQGKREHAAYFPLKNELRITIYKNECHVLQFALKKTKAPSLPLVEISQTMRFGFMNHFFHDGKGPQGRPESGRKHHECSVVCQECEEDVVLRIERENDKCFDLEHFLLDHSESEGPLREHLKEINDYSKSLVSTNTYRRFDVHFGSKDSQYSTNSVLESLRRLIKRNDRLREELYAYCCKKKFSITSALDICDNYKLLESFKEDDEGVIVWSGNTDTLFLSLSELNRADTRENMVDHSIEDVMGVEMNIPGDFFGDKETAVDFAVVLSATLENQLLIQDAYEHNLACIAFVSIVCNLVDIVIAIVYDDLITCGMGSTESTWTIENMSTTLRFNRKFVSRADTLPLNMGDSFNLNTPLKDVLRIQIRKVVEASLSRCVSMAMIRSIKIFALALRATRSLFEQHADQLMKHMVRTVLIFQKDDQRSFYVRAFLKPYLAWIHVGLRKGALHEIFKEVSSSLKGSENMLERGDLELLILKKFHE